MPGLGGASLVVQMVKNLPAMQETWAQSLDHEDTLEKGMAMPLPFLPGGSVGQRSLAGYTVHGVAESDTWNGTYPSAPLFLGLSHWAKATLLAFLASSLQVTVCGTTQPP